MGGRTVRFIPSDAMTEQPDDAVGTIISGPTPHAAGLAARGSMME